MPTGWLLALETATSVLGVALLYDGALVLERRRVGGPPASTTLLPAVEGVLAEAGIRPSALAALAVSIGPGSFTGLRVGLATAKGLVLPDPRPVAAVSTLAALAAAAGPREEPVAALLDARRGEVYAAVYPGEGGGLAAPLLSEGVVRPEELAERLPVPCTVVGEGVVVAAEALRARHGEAVRVVPPERVLPGASHVGRIGTAMLARGLGRPAAELVPRYLRRAEAEVRRTGERFEAPPEGAPGRFDTSAKLP